MPSLTVLVAGSSGFIGTALRARLERDGHVVRRLVRRAAESPDEIAWEPEEGRLPADALAGVDAVVNLAGYSLTHLPWTPARRRRILDSRVAATTTLAAAIRDAARPPAVFLSGSASGFYGDRGAERLTETSASGTGFLAEVCRRWEYEALAAEPVTRVVLLRTGIVIGRGGGALQPLVPLTRLGLGARLGSGAQRWPWISLDDEVGAIIHLLTSEVAGPVNLAGPEPASADRISARLAAELGRPYLLAAPRWAIELGLGAAGREMLLASTPLAPEALLADGFRFSHSAPEAAIAAAVRA